MSDKTEDTGSEEIKGYPDGSTKVVHTELSLFNLSAKLKNKDGQPYGKTGKGVKIIYEDGEYGPKEIKLPEGKFGTAALKVPRNKKLWDDLNKDIETDEPVTLYFIKENGYWDMTGITAGHVGTAGVTKPAGSGEAAGGGVTHQPYDASGAIIGKISNHAFDLALLNAKKGSDLDDVLNAAIKLLEDADASLYTKMDAAAREFYNAHKGSSQQVDKPVNKPEPAGSVGDSGATPDDDDDDEDIPY
jgi:hypothetical protein